MLLVFLPEGVPPVRQPAIDPSTYEEKLEERSVIRLLQKPWNVLNLVLDLEEWMNLRDDGSCPFETMRSATSSQSPHLFIAKTAHDMIVYHSYSLHEGIAYDRPNKCEAVPFQIFAQGC